MARYTKISFMRPNRPWRKKDLLGLLTTILMVIGGILLLLPVLTVILVVALGVGLALFVAGGIWWLVKGRKIFKRAQEDMQQAVQQQQPEDQTRKWVQVKIQRLDEEPSDEA